MDPGKLYAKTNLTSNGTRAVSPHLRHYPDHPIPAPLSPSRPPSRRSHVSLPPPACCASCTSGRESTMVTSSTSEKCRQLAVSVEQATLKDTSNSHAICKLCLPPRNRCSWVPCSSASHRKLHHHRAGGQDLGFSPRVPHITPLPHLLVNWARMENSGARF